MKPAIEMKESNETLIQSVKNKILMHLRKHKILKVSATGWLTLEQKDREEIICELAMCGELIGIDFDFSESVGIDLLERERALDHLLSLVLKTQLFLQSCSVALGYKVKTNNVEILAQLLSKNRFLTRIELGWVQRYSESSQKIPDIFCGALKYHTNICALILNGNFYEFDIDKLLILLAANIGLEVLDVNLLSLNNHVISLFSQVLLNRKNIISFKCSLHGYGRSGLLQLNQVFLNQENLMILEVSNCTDPLDSEPTDFFDSIKECRNITDLSLARNGLKSEDLQLLVPILHNMKRLVKLDLSRNSFANDDMKSLSPVLINNSNITRLDLTCNSVGYKGISILLLALHRNPRSIELKACCDAGRASRYSNNSIDENDLDILRGVLSNLKSDIQLELIRTSGFTKIYPFRDVIFQNKHILGLYFSWIRWGTDGINRVSIEEEDIKRLCSNEACGENRSIQGRVRQNWMRVSLLTAFIRANEKNALKYSVLPLIPEVIEMAHPKIERMQSNALR